jgi:adenosylmethionine-8-amino-7-oxononanoate aminotransferase
MQCRVSGVTCAVVPLTMLCVMSSFVDTSGVKSVGQGGHGCTTSTNPLTCKPAVENLFHIHRKIGYAPTLLKKLVNL